GAGCWRRWTPPGIILQAARCPGGVSPWGVEPRAPGPAGPRTPCRRRLRRGRGLQAHVAAVSRRAFGQPGGPSIVGAPPPACQDGHAGYRKKTLRRLPEKSAPSLPQASVPHPPRLPHLAFDRRRLAAVLKEQLSGIKVFKVGDEAERDAYVVGKTADGKWAGLKTTVVET